MATVQAQMIPFSAPPGAVESPALVKLRTSTIRAYLAAAAA
jgi:hypothetical protein